MNLKSKLAGALVRLKKWVSRFQRKREIFVVMEGGVVHEIVNLPTNINVTVIDYDTEGVEKERLEISPVDGELCVINNGKAVMHDYIIEAMVKALKPVLKNPAKAKQILDRFWSDKMALVWDVQDVHTAANEREVALTNQEAIKVLQELHHYHNKQCGIKWVDVTCYIEEYALGRKLTKAEVKRFVEKNILTIDRKRR